MLLTIRGSRQKEKVMYYADNKENTESNYLKKNLGFSTVTNPLNNKKSSSILNLYEMIEEIIKAEFPSLKNTNLLTDLTLYSMIDKIQTVQTIENVLSCITHTDKLVNENGEVEEEYKQTLISQVVV